MRYLITLSLIVFAGSAQAHPGHLAGVAGHDHWVAGAAIGLAILAGIYGALKGRKEKAEADAAEADETEEEGVPA